MGSWLNYGLGSESQNLPGFVVMLSGGGHAQRRRGLLEQRIFADGLSGRAIPLAGRSGAVPFQSSGHERAGTATCPLDALRDLNEMEMNVTGDPEIATRINSFEMAYRMQTSAPELMDIASEPKAIHELYGTEPGKVSFANNCLLARRLIERGVRFVQLYHRGWDHHGTDCEDGHCESATGNCANQCRGSGPPNGGAGERPQAARAVG